MVKFNYDPNIKKYKFEQIRDEIIRNIENGGLKQGELIASVLELRQNYSISKVTIDRAYMYLKEKGYINYVAGKGYYVSEKQKDEKRILLVFNKLSNFKKNIYCGFVEVLGKYGKVDLQIHHYDIRELEEILSCNIANYDYFVVMPHFKYETSKKEILKVLNIVPSTQLLLLDKKFSELKNCSASVYQDFKLDIYEALNSVADLFIKYNTLKLVIPSDDYHPLEIVSGAQMFCEENEKEFEVIENLENEVLSAGSSFVVVDESDLAYLIKKIRNTDLVIGKDIGVISFNETVLKEFLDITVFSTDFFGMGCQAAQMILQNNFKKLRNPFTIIRRKSF